MSHDPTPPRPSARGPRLFALGDGERIRRLRRSLITWLAVVVVVITLGGTAVNWLTVDRDPQDPVEDWLDAMADGRSRQGLALFETPEGDSGASPMPNAVYRNAQGRISSWEIVDVQQDGQRARVTARLGWPEDQVPPGAVQGQEHTWAVHRVTRTGPLNDYWELDEAEAAVLTVQAPGVREIRINGRDTDLDPESRAVAVGSGGAWQWEAMPGRFAVDMPADSHYQAADGEQSAHVALGDPQPQTVRLRVEPSPVLWHVVDEQIRGAIEDCMSEESVSPEGCPSSLRWAEGGVPRADTAEDARITTPSDGLGRPRIGAEVTDVEWELVSRPALWLIPDGDSDSPLDWRASDHQKARATLRYQEDGRQVEEVVDFAVDVRAHSDGRDAEVRVDLR